MINKKNFWTAIILLFLLNTAIVPAQAFNNVRKGEKAPGFTANKIDGVSFSLDSLIGKKAVILFFWKLEISGEAKEGESSGKVYDASTKWIQEIAALQKMNSKYKTDGLEIIGVTAPVKSVYDKQNKNVRNPDFTQDEITAINKYLKDNEITFTVILDEGLKIYNDYGVVPFPSTAIINTEGIIIHELSSYPTFGGEKILEENIKIATGLVKPAEGKKTEKYVPKPKASEHYKKAVQFREKDKIDKTIEELKLAVQEDPKYIDPHKILAAIYREKKETENAMIELATLLELEPENPMNHILYGDFSLENGMPEDAKKEYELAIKGDTTGTEYIGRGGEAKKRIRKIASGDAYYGLGMLAVKEKKKDEAIEYFLKALTFFEGNTSEGDMIEQMSKRKEIHPNQPKAHYELGILYLEKGDEDKSIKEFKEGISSYQTIIKKLLKQKWD
ncbi:redoxin domain-containing protein [Candidatus Desantisbacteria bacterium]|nr:redoxin domain-containing protein [Candidatus Desantisbacteria bacterium]